MMLFEDEIVARGKKQILAAAKRLRAEEQDAKRAKRRELAEATAGKAGPLPFGRRFCVIYADPAWEFETRSERGGDRSAANHYATMTLAEIMELEVSEIAAKDAMLFLWTTSPHLEQALEVIRRWGFSYKSTCIWAKDKIGTGYWFRNKHEQLLLATRGGPAPPDPADRFPSLVEAPVTGHSEKPPIFREMIEVMTPGLSRIELCARGTAPPDWTFWGNEAANGSHPRHEGLIPQVVAV